MSPRGVITPPLWFKLQIVKGVFLDVSFTQSELPFIPFCVPSPRLPIRPLEKGMGEEGRTAGYRWDPRVLAYCTGV